MNSCSIKSLAAAHVFVPTQLAELVRVVKPLGRLPFRVLEDGGCQHGLRDQVSVRQAEWVSASDKTECPRAAPQLFP